MEPESHVGVESFAVADALELGGETFALTDGLTAGDGTFALAGPCVTEAREKQTTRHPRGTRNAPRCSPERAGGSPRTISQS